MQVVETAIFESVDFVIIAGDLYDGDWRDYNTGLFFCKEMGRLNEASIPVYLLYGNHDAESTITKQLTLPANVHTFSAKKPQTHRLEDKKVALHGQSFKEAETTENLVTGYPSPIKGWLNIGVLHTALEGYAQHASYAPCTKSELQAFGYDYWALGHVHQHTILSEDPWIVFSGNPQGRHIREDGPRSAVLVTVEDAQFRIERIYTDVLRWHRLELDVSSAENLDDVVDLARTALEQLVTDLADGRPLAVRVIVMGKTAAHGDLFNLESQLRNEILAHAIALGDEVLWIEKLQINTQPVLDAEHLKARSGAIADLQLMLEEAVHDTELSDSIVSDLRDLVTRSPKQLIDLVPALDLLRQEQISELLADVTPGLVARLSQEASLSQET